MKQTDSLLDAQTKQVVEKLAQELSDRMSGGENWYQ